MRTGLHGGTHRDLHVSTPLIPRSLLWRTFLLLAALVLLTTAAWFQIFRSYEIEPRARALAQNLVSVVNLTHVALLTAQPEKRRDLLAELAEREGIQVYPSEPGELIVAMADTPVLELAKSLMREQLGAETRFAVRRDGLPGLWVSFSIEDDEYWVRIPRERLERRIAMRWVAWGLLALALALTAAYLIVSRVSRPLHSLAAAAGEIGRGRRPDPVPESGPQEIRTLASAFNQMSQGLSRLEQDRALILAGVSHDLRTPLARLRLGIEMSSQDEALRAGMHGDIEEMDRIIGQFLDFARLDGGEANQVIELDVILEEVVERYRKLGHDVAASVEPVQLSCKPLMLRRALANLIDNALRYSGTAVEARLRKDDAPAGMRYPATVVIEVLDRGPGIPQSETERLKQPFTRLEQARSGSGGSGLGLAIVDRVVHAHGGSFELGAREGGGLVARLRIPIRAA